MKVTKTKSRPTLDKPRNLKKRKKEKRKRKEYKCEKDGDIKALYKNLSIISRSSLDNHIGSTSTHKY
jgi:hypothetical protein